MLLEDNLAMAGRLSAAGNAVDLPIHPDPHGFTGHATRLATTALSGIYSWLRERSDDAAQVPFSVKRITVFTGNTPTWS